MDSELSTPKKFDPYHRWLAIPPSEQPPDYYRLLGLTRFESDPAVIENAADRQMAHVRTFQHGPQAMFSQQILSELATAKLWLINSDRRAAYNATLAGSGLEPAQPIAQPVDAASLYPPSSPPPNVNEPSVSAGAAGSSRKLSRSARTRKKRNARDELLKIAAGGVAGIVIAIPLLWYVLGADPFGIFSGSEEVPQSVVQSETPPASDDSSDHPATSREIWDDVDPSPTDGAPEPRDHPDPFSRVDPPSSAPASVPLPPVQAEPDDSASAPALLPVPDASDISTVRESLAEYLTEVPPSGLLAAARQRGDSVERYVLITAAQDAAAESGNVDLAYLALETLASQFEIELLQEKVDLLGIIESAADSASIQAQLAAKGIQLAEESLEAERSDLAVLSSQIALKCARDSGDAALIREATLLVIKVARQQNSGQLEDTTGQAESG